MLLSNQLRYLFVHVAKTGGTSIRTALQPMRWRDPYFYPQLICSRLSSMTGHRIGAKFPRHAKIIAAKEMLPEELFGQLFKFAIVRNPWDLQVSSYHHIRRERPHLMAHINNFEQFIHWKLDSERPYQFHVDTSIEQQSDYLVDLHGKLLTDFIGRYENLNNDFNTICDHIGIKAPALPHRRKATDRDIDYRSYYTDALTEKIAAHFQQDIELLGYSFE
jgi:hypothetical protein